MDNSDNLPGPTRADCDRLARLHQARSVKRADPLAAMAGVINGGLQMVTNRLFDRALAELAGDKLPEPGTRPLEHTALCFKGAREICRYTVLELRLAGRGADEVPPRRGEEREV